MRRLLAVLGAAMLVALSCSPGTSTVPPAATGSAAASETPVAGGRIVASLQGDPKTFQPVISGDTGSSAAWGWFYISLVRNDPKTGENIGALAEKFSFSSDGLTLTWTLRDGLVWSDGSAFTGDDYKFTGEAVMRSKKTSRKSNLDNVVGAKDFADGKADNITGITVKDGGKTIEVKLTKTFCTAVSSLASFGTGGIIPKKIFGKYLDPKDPTKNLDDAPENSAPPQMSMGPFIFKEFKPGVQVSYSKNPKYYRGAPLIDEYIIKIYPDDTSIKNALVTGEVDYAGVAAKDYDEVVKVDQLKGYEFPRLVYRYLGWGTVDPAAPFLKVKEVRQALWHALDVDALVKKNLFGHGSRVFSHSLPISWAYDETGLNKYPYDQAKAKQLLEKAGAKMGTDGFYRWSDGKVMELKLETNQGNTAAETTVQYAAEQYKQIGIKASSTLESSNAFLDRVDPSTVDLQGYYLGWSLSADPDPFSIWHSSQGKAKGQFNATHVENPDLDKALEANRNGPDCSKEARKKALHQVDLVLNDNAYYAFLYADNALTFINKRLRGTDPQTFSTTYNIELWWLKQ
jgi:peptide/nickel transport system substrate-binding protein